MDHAPIASNLGLLLFLIYIINFATYRFPISAITFCHILHKDNLNTGHELQGADNDTNIF